MAFKMPLTDFLVVGMNIGTGMGMGNGTSFIAGAVNMTVGIGT